MFYNNGIDLKSQIQRKKNQIISRISDLKSQMASLELTNIDEAEIDLFQTLGIFQSYTTVTCYTENWKKTFTSKKGIWKHQSKIHKQKCMIAKKEFMAKVFVFFDNIFRY